MYIHIHIYMYVYDREACWHSSNIERERSSKRLVHQSNQTAWQSPSLTIRTRASKERKSPCSSVLLGTQRHSCRSPACHLQAVWHCLLIRSYHTFDTADLDFHLPWFGSATFRDTHPFDVQRDTHIRTCSVKTHTSSVRPTSMWCSAKR